MRKGFDYRAGFAVLSLPLFALSCSDDSGPSSGVGDTAGAGGSGAAGPTIVGGNGVQIPTGSGGRGGAGGADPSCGPCGLGQRCETAGGRTECVDNDCSDLTCGPSEECQPVVDGGNRCVSIGCDSDLDCAISRFCDGAKCVEDECEGGSRRCDGDEVLVCDSSGSGETSPYACAGLGSDRFESTCSEKSSNASGCTCEDDWDCPPNTVCEAGFCSGTGKVPTCTLAPTPLPDVLPQLEFRWATQPDRVPFSWSRQVASTPLVVNLDDDNGDGLIDEFDFPEIVFITYEKLAGGIVRAVHGGGPQKGKDYFALCGQPAAPGNDSPNYGDEKGGYWREGASLRNDCNDDPKTEHRELSIVRPGSILAAGDLDADGAPEIVALTEKGGAMILSNRGELIAKSAEGLWPTTGWTSPAAAIANLDFADRPEIIVGNRVLTLSKTGPLAFEQVLTGSAEPGTTAFETAPEYYGPVTCIADLSPEPGLEIVAATSLYRMPERPANCDGSNATSDYCEGRLLTVWDAAAVSSNSGMDFYPGGFCAVADVLGATPGEPPGPDNPLDGVPEVVLVSDAHVLILQGTDEGPLEPGAILRNLEIPGGGVQGGAPNVDDFDGDGFPEIGTALANRYAMIDLQAPAESCPAWTDTLEDETGPGQNPARDPGGACDGDGDCNAGAVCNPRVGACVCLHNGWMRTSEDDSSRVTSSSVFDFNGDGAAEVIYNDECYFHVFDGRSGGVQLAIPSLSRTIMENPVVADTDNDGNAEIVFVQNNENIQCDAASLASWPKGDADVSTATLPSGIEVWSDPSDAWVTARRIWNQHGYHVTNVLESGGIPLHEPESWLPLNGRIYNTYRSQPREYEVAPDLAVRAIQVSSPGSACGSLSNEIQIVVEVRNQGDLRVGPGVAVEVLGTWDGSESALLDDDGEALGVQLTKSLEPSDSTYVTLTYTVGNNPAPDDTTLPDSIRATVDGGNGASAGSQRECDEENNELEAALEPGLALPDLSVTVLDASCIGELTVVVENVGASSVEDVLVRAYAGDPSTRGEVLGETVVAGPLGAGESTEVVLATSVVTRTVEVWAAADPLNTIEECNDGNNLGMGPRLDCSMIQ